MRKKAKIYIATPFWSWCTYRWLYIKSGPYQFFPGKYIWVFYFPSYDLIISVFFIQLYKINFFHIVFVIHIVVIIFWNMKIRCFYWYSNYKDVPAWQKLFVLFLLPSISTSRTLRFSSLWPVLWQTGWQTTFWSAGNDIRLTTLSSWSASPPTLRVTFLWIFVELINEAYPAQITLHLRWTNASLSLDPLFTWRHGDLFHQWTYLSGKAAYPMYQLTSTRAANREFLVKWIMELYSVLDYFRSCKPWHCLCYKLVRCWRI